jgi:hypothetical protein
MSWNKFTIFATRTNHVIMGKDLNSLKSVLVEQKTGKWLVG